jgi:hypothetical protein
MSVSVGAPLPNEIMHFIYEHALQDIAPIQSETVCIKTSRIALKTITLGFAIAGLVPNIPVALKAGGNDRALGHTILVSNFASRGSLCTWSYHKIIDGELGSDGQIRKQIADKNNALAAKTAIKITVFAIALIAQTPRAYLAFVYNDQNIAYPIMTYMALTAIPAYSLDLTFRALLEKSKLSPFEILLNKVKEDFSSKIKTCRSKIIDLSQADKEKLLASLTPPDQRSEEAAVTYFISKVCREGTLPPQVETTSQKIRKVLARGLGCLMGTTATVAQLGYYYWIGVKGAEAVWDNQAFAHTTGALIVASNVYLTTKVMFESSDRLSNQLFFKPKQLLTNHAVSSVLIPKTRAAVGLTTIAISLFSTGTTVQPVRDYFTGDLFSIMVVMAPLSIYLLGRNALEDFVDEICNHSTRSCHTPPIDKGLLKLDHSLERLNFIIQKMSFKNFAKLLLSLPDGFHADFVKHGVTKELLKTYLGQ